MSKAYNFIFKLGMCKWAINLLFYTTFIYKETHVQMLRNLSDFIVGMTKYMHFVKVAATFHWENIVCGNLIRKLQIKPCMVYQGLFNTNLKSGVLWNYSIIMHFVKEEKEVCRKQWRQSTFQRIIFIGNFAQTLFSLWVKRSNLPINKLLQNHI